jgi:hypothetical protein
MEEAFSLDQNVGMVTRLVAVYIWSFSGKKSILEFITIFKVGTYRILKN